MSTQHVEVSTYEAPALTEYGTIEEWTKQECHSIVCVTVII